MRNPSHEEGGGRYARPHNVAKAAVRREGTSFDEWLRALEKRQSADEDVVMRQPVRRPLRAGPSDEDETGRGQAYASSRGVSSDAGHASFSSPLRNPLRRETAQGAQSQSAVSLEALQERYRSLEALVDNLMSSAQPAPQPASRSNGRSHLTDLSRHMEAGHAEREPYSPMRGTRRPAAGDPSRPSTEVKALMEELQAMAGNIQSLRAELDERGAPDNDPPPLNDRRADFTDMIASLRSAPSREAPDQHVLRAAIADLREDLAAVFDQFIASQSHVSYDRLQASINDLSNQIAHMRQRGGHDMMGQLDGFLEQMRADAQQTYARHSAGIESQIAGLARRIDTSLVSQVDAGQLHDLQSQLEDVRHSLSLIDLKPAFDLLAREMRVLSEKLDMLPQGGGLSNEIMSRLGMRFDDLARRIDARAPSLAAFDELATTRLEEAMMALSRRLDSLEAPSARPDNLAAIEQAIMTLSERLDRSGDTTGRLGVIERGLADLFVQIEDTRAAAFDPHNAASHAQDSLREDIREALASLQARSEAVDARNHAMLQSVGNILQSVMERIERVEQQSHGEPRTAMPASVLPEAAPAVIRSEKSDTPQHGEHAHAHAPAPEPAQVPAPERAEAIKAFRRAAPQNTEPAPKIQQVKAPPPHPPLKIVEPSDFTAMDMQRPLPEMSIKPRLRKSVLIGVGALLLVAAALQIGVQTLRRNTSKDAASSQASLPSTPSKSLNRLPAERSVPAQADGKSATELSALEAQNNSQSSSQEIAAVQAPPVMAAPAAPSLPPPAEVTGALGPRAIVGTIPGSSLSTGWGLTDGTAATKLPKRLLAAAENGDAAAAYEVASRFIDGRGVNADLTQAAQWFRKAADAGFAPAQWTYGNMLDRGAGIGRNIEEAMRYYKMAADQGNVKAIYSLAVLHASNVSGAKADYALSTRYFQQAAEFGLVDAQYNLGILNNRNQNYVESYKWFALAANSGDAEAAKKRETIAEKLSPADLLRAKQMVAAFSPKPQNDQVNLAPVAQASWDDGPSPSQLPVRSVKTTKPVGG